MFVLGCMSIAMIYYSIGFIFWTAKCSRFRLSHFKPSGDMGERIVTSGNDVSADEIVLQERDHRSERLTRAEHRQNSALLVCTHFSAVLCAGFGSICSNMIKGPGVASFTCRAPKHHQASAAVLLGVSALLLLLVWITLLLTDTNISGLSSYFFQFLGGDQQHELTEVTKLWRKFQMNQEVAGKRLLEVRSLRFICVH